MATKRATKTKIVPEPFVVLSGEGWKIVRMPETRDYAVWIEENLIGYRATVQEAEILRQGYSYDALLHIPAQYDITDSRAVCA